MRGRKGINLYLKFALRGSAVGMSIAALALLPLHLTDPYYNNTNTAKEIFWFVIAPSFIVLSTVSCSIIGLVIAWVIKKRHKV